VRFSAVTFLRLAELGFFIAIALGPCHDNACP
jgi:hypothetical protein